MVTPNKLLNQPSTGAEIGTWGNSINNNMGTLDTALGGLLALAVTNGTIVLTSGQYQNTFMIFTGNLTGNVNITLPSVGSFYSVQNLTSNSSQFTVVLQTAAVGSEHIGIPPGSEFVDVFTDGANVRYRNFGMVGSYMETTYLSVPGWISACTVPPYIYCNGQAFSSATYPVLYTVMGGRANVPDLRGQLLWDLDGGTNRNTTWLTGNTLFTAGGFESANVPTNNLPWAVGPQFTSSATAGFSSDVSLLQPVAVGANLSNLPPTIRTGFTFVRAG